MYTTIIHPLRKSLNISCNEYCVLDTIYHLSNNSKYGGWCIKSRQNIADDLDLSKQTVITIIDNLEKKGLILKNEDTKFLRPCDLYCEAIQQKNDWIVGKISGEKMISGNISVGKESLPECLTDGKESLPHRSRNFTDIGQETLPNNNIYTN